MLWGDRKKWYFKTYISTLDIILTVKKVVIFDLKCTAMHLDSFLAMVSKQQLK